MSLSANDHFVSVETVKGSFDVRMRLADAMSEVSAIDGFQIHRSHWVSKDALVEISKENGKLFIVLVNDKKLPISRARHGEVKQALEEVFIKKNYKAVNRI